MPRGEGGRESESVKERHANRFSEGTFLFFGKVQRFAEAYNQCKISSQVTRMEPERRRTPRYPFAASAELVEPSSGVKSTLKVTELSLNGCFVQAPNPLEKGTSVLLKIYKDPQYFEARATVMYATPNQGMGLTFHEVKPFFVGVLQKWLLAAMVSRKAPQA